MGDEEEGKKKTPVVESEQERTLAKQFCSKVSEADAEKLCNDWLQSQKTSLGTRLLTTYCSPGELGDVNGCFYRSMGEVKYILKKVTK